MTRTPTAEEVLAKYREWQEAESQWSDSEDERFNLATAAMVARDSFEYAYDQWQAAQGPVTREWFVERFGGFHPGIEIVFDRENGPELVCRKCGRWIKLHNPTRSKIESLVEMLGGESCG